MASNDLMMIDIVRRQDGTCWRVVRVLRDEPNLYQGETMWLKVEYSPELTNQVVQHQKECETLLQNMVEKQQMLEKELVLYQKTQRLPCVIM